MIEKLFKSYTLHIQIAKNESGEEMINTVKRVLLFWNLETV